MPLSGQVTLVPQREIVVGYRTFLFWPMASLRLLTHVQGKAKDKVQETRIIAINLGQYTNHRYILRTVCLLKLYGPFEGRRGSKLELEDR